MAVTNSTVTNGKMVVTGDKDDTRGISYIKQITLTIIRTFSKNKYTYIHYTTMTKLQNNDTMQQEAQLSLRDHASMLSVIIW